MHKAKMNRSGLFFFIVLAVFLAGCHSLKAPSRPDEMWMPPKWERSLKRTDNVWGSIRKREEKTELSDKLTLIELINIALKNNPSTSKAWHNAKAEEAVRAQARSAWYPLVTFAGDLTKDRKVADQKSDEFNTRSYGGALSASILAFDFGGRAASLTEAHHSVLAANFEFNQSMQDLILNVETSYYALYSAKSSLDAAVANTEDAKASYDAAKQRFDVGVGTRLDMLQSKASYDESLFELEEAKANLAGAKADLAEVLGVSADTDFDISEPKWKIPTELTKQDVSKLIEEAISRRPDIAASRATLLAKQDAVKGAFSDLLPSLSVGSTAAKRWTEYFGDSKAYKNYYEYTGFLKVSWDVFDGFKNYAELKEAQSTAKAEREQLIQNELAASGDVWTKYYAFKTSVSKFDFSKAFFRSSEESYNLALEGYKSGVKNILDVLQAQSDLADARSKLVQSKKDLLVALSGIAHATGSLGIQGSGEYLKEKE